MSLRIIPRPRVSIDCCQRPLGVLIVGLEAGIAVPHRRHPPSTRWRAGVERARVDLVVEGADDSRLAVECDGDKYQGPQQWIEDMRRQRSLERVGWVFWRCFAAAFMRRREAVLEDLRRALTARGIEPVGRGGWGRRRVCETRRISAPGKVAAA